MQIALDGSAVNWTDPFWGESRSWLAIDDQTAAPSGDSDVFGMINLSSDRAG